MLSFSFSCFPEIVPLKGSDLQAFVCVIVVFSRTVQVIKLISKDTIEDCILQLGQKKLKLEQEMTATEEGEDTCTHSENVLEIFTQENGNILAKQFCILVFGGFKDII